MVMELRKPTWNWLFPNLSKQIVGRMRLDSQGCWPSVKFIWTAEYLWEGKKVSEWENCGVCEKLEDVFARATEKPVIPDV